LFALSVVTKEVLSEYLKKKTSKQALQQYTGGLVYFVKYFIIKEGFLKF